MSKSFTWQEIFTCYKRLANRISPELLDQMDVIKINFKYEGKWQIAGYDWIESTNYDKRIHYITEQTDSFLYFGPSLKKGTLQTLEYLVDAKEDSEILAAIWIYATLKEVQNYIPDSWRGEGYRIISKVEDAVFILLKENGIAWHHAMRSLVPEIYFSHSLLENITIDTLSTLIELIIINSAFIKKNYKIVYFESYK